MEFVVVKETTVYAFCGNVHSVVTEIVEEHETMFNALTAANILKNTSGDYGVKFYAMAKELFNSNEQKHLQKAVDAVVDVR